MKANHVETDYLRFILGGKDRKIHDGFNGQINRPLIRLGRGSYIDSIPNFEQWILGCNPKPYIYNPPGNIDIVEAPEV